MKKRIISLVLAVSFVLASALSTYAASFAISGNAKTPTAVTYKDIRRLAELATKVRGKDARVVNATKYNGSATTWIVRLSFGEAGDQCAADFVLTTYPYARDPKTQMITTLPFSTPEEGTAKFGPCWYYFGLFDDISHDSCGFAVCERIKRWPDWKDLTFTGTTYRGVHYTGCYNEGNMENFLEVHTN